MTETRKELIKILEPYMEKDLSLWCYVLDFKENLQRIIYVLNEDNIWLEDITVVLKYLTLYWCDVIVNNQMQIKWSYICIKNNWILQDNIPNKPLYLYTEQEEENLLKLLKELWKE